MRLKLFLLPLLVALFLVSCNDDEMKKNPSTMEDVKVTVVNKKCQIQTMNFDFGDKKRVLEFKYQNRKLAKVETIENGVDLNQTMAFNYNDHGGIQTFLSGAVIAAYIYDDKNRILKINGNKGLSTRTFEYNENGQISKQITINGGRPYIIHEYKYDKKGHPIEVSIYDNKGELTEVNQIKYDNQINPFKNKGVFVNSMEMLLGFGVGNFDHNVVEIVKTYKKDTNYKINGAYKLAGEKEVNKIKYKYNENGYPVEMFRIRSGSETVMTLTYKCD